MIIKETGYSYNDLTVVPEVISDIESRSQCNPFVKDNWLPIFTAPMASVVDDHNLELFTKNGIMPILPRNISLETRKEWMLDYHWVALSLSEFKNEFIENAHEREKTSYYICVDIANGHMKSLYDVCLSAKKLAKKYDYKLIIMTGNIANPKTYEWICNFNHKHSCSVIDYIRVGIGGGKGCFIDGTKIKTINGEKNIEDINIGDKVLTIDNTYQDVIDKTRFKSNELIKINNEITSTINHKFFVINKSDKDKVNEQNLEKYGYWVEANKLNKNKHLLIKYE